MLVELIGLELRKAAYTFWLFSDGLVLLVLGKDSLRIFVSMFLNEFFESHWFLPLVFHEGICFLSSIQFLEVMTNMPIGHPFRRPAAWGELRLPLLLAPIAKGRSYFCATRCNCH